MLAGLFMAQPVFSQGEGESRKHKRMWWRFGRKRHPDAFNPYVKRDKSTHEVSRRQKREDDKAIRRARKEYKKSIRKSARKRGGR